MTVSELGHSHHRAAAHRAHAPSLASICLVLLLAACGEDAPLAPPPPRLDTTQLVAFLKDPFVIQLPELLADRAAAGPVQRALADLTSVAADGYVTPLRKSFLAMHRSVERYRAEAKPDATDPVILDNLDLVLFQAERLVGMNGTGDGDAAIELR
jgi:hypothetical protein